MGYALASSVGRPALGFVHPTSEAQMNHQTPRFETRPNDPSFGATIIATATEDWTSNANGLVSLHFQRRRGDHFVEYARIDGISSDHVKRVVAVWCLSHPWRPVTIVRMIGASFKAYRQMRRVRLLNQQGDVTTAA